MQKVIKILKFAFIIIAIHCIFNFQYCVDESLYHIFMIKNSVFSMYALIRSNTSVSIWLAHDRPNIFVDIIECYGDSSAVLVCLNLFFLSQFCSLFLHMNVWFFFFLLLICVHTRAQDRDGRHGIWAYFSAFDVLAFIGISAYTYHEWNRLIWTHGRQSRWCRCSKWAIRVPVPSTKPSCRMVFVGRKPIPHWRALSVRNMSTKNMWHANGYNRRHRKSTGIAKSMKNWRNRSARRKA